MKRSIYILTAVLFIALLALPAFCQDDKDAATKEAPPAQAPAQPVTAAPAAVAAPAPASAPTIPAPAAKEEAASAKELSIYGEVQAVNAGTNSMTVQYYDYDSDEEKTIEMAANKDTKIENAAALANINKGDWVDVTYTVIDGKNVARSIMVEKEEKDEVAPGIATPETKPAESPEE